MNKIELKNNIVNDSYDYSEDFLKIKKSGSYYIEYEKSINNLNISFDSNINVKILEISNGKQFINNIKYDVNNASNVVICKFCNNKSISEEIIINLLGEEATINYNLACISNGEDSIKFIINHLNKKTLSNVTNRILSPKNGECTLSIDSVVKKDKYDCKLSQSSKGIVLEDGSVSVKPNMYIDCNEISAKHSASIGKFNEDMIFYLMSRGINKEDAIELLIQSFIKSNFIFDREEVLDIINKYWR